MRYRRSGMSLVVVTLVLCALLGCAKGPGTESQDAAMKAGLDALYTRRDPQAAAEEFRKVLALNPEHYGANYQLAFALDQMQKPAEAAPYWQKTLASAEAYGDRTTADTARSRLGQVAEATSPQNAAMQAGLDALYTKHDPQAAVAAFGKVLELNPNHYGATFQLAKALEQAGNEEAARAQWQKMLSLAEAAGDQPVADTARAHLGKTP